MEVTFVASAAKLALLATGYRHMRTSSYQYVKYYASAGIETTHLGFLNEPDYT
jgi:O-glycosyl hydrolase